MNYTEFFSALFDLLQEAAGPDITLTYQQVSKNNNVLLDAITMISPTVNLSPTIYIPPYYHRYLDGMELSAIVADIMSAYEQNLPRDNFDVSRFTDYEKAKDNIVLRLVNYERNRPLLATVPHKRFLDFAILFYCLLETDSTHQANILIRSQHLNFWNVDADALYEDAIRNSPRLLKSQLFNLYDILQQVMDDLCTADPSELIPMYALSNVQRTYGAGAILYPDVLSQIADAFEHDLVIIPSSVHEVLILPTDDLPDPTYITKMIREVNETQLADEEVLSDHPYYYSRSERMMTQSPIRPMLTS